MDCSLKFRLVDDTPKEVKQKTESYNNHTQKDDCLCKDCNDYKLKYEANNSFELVFTDENNLLEKFRDGEMDTKETIKERIERYMDQDRYYEVSVLAFILSKWKENTKTCLFEHKEYIWD